MSGGCGVGEGMCGGSGFSGSGGGGMCGGGGGTGRGDGGVGGADMRGEAVHVRERYGDFEAMVPHLGMLVWGGDISVYGHNPHYSPLYVL
jgi:hypothetical protein